MTSHRHPVARFVELDRVGKLYVAANGTVAALEEVSLGIGRGEFVAIVGPSGSGKTTLLNLVARLMEPTTGRIDRSPALDRVGAMAMIFQSPTLLPWRSVVRNVLLPAEVLDMPRAGARSKALSLLDLVGLAGFEAAYPHQLSGGMQQRVSLCRALMSDPDLLLMDEPFGALDAITRESMTGELQRIWMDQQSTVLYVTHSMTEAIFLADRIVVLTPRPGRVAGILDNEIPRPRSVRTFETAEFTKYSIRLREMISERWAL